MKTLENIYDSINKRFYEKTNIDIEQGTIIDLYNLANAEMLEEAYQEIENNKTPHIFTSLSGENLDNMGILCGVARRPSETDKNYLYRILNWNVSNKSSNLTSIETALMDMVYASHVTHVPHAFGCGTAAAYIIPKDISDNGKALALAETKSRLANVISPSSYVEYIIPTIIPIKLVLLIKSELSDISYIKSNINGQILEYINSIAPGDYLEVGDINKIGINQIGINYFNVGHLFISDNETGDLSILQTVESKFLISENDITWLEVE